MLAADNNITLVDCSQNRFLSTPVAAKAVRIQLEIVPKRLPSRNAASSFFPINHNQVIGLCCLMTPGLSKDIQCHVWSYFYKQVQISRSDIRPHIKWAVSLVILHMITSIFLRALCGYIWVNILTHNQDGSWLACEWHNPSSIHWIFSSYKCITISYSTICYLYTLHLVCAEHSPS